MGRAERVRLTRRDMLKLSAGGAGMFALTASGLAVPRGFGKGGSLYIEAFPTSPLILSPFNDALPVPRALAPIAKANVDLWDRTPAKDSQDCFDQDSTSGYGGRYGPTLGTQQVWPDTDPLVYQIKLQVAGHDFTSSSVQPVDSKGKDAKPPGS